MKIEFIYNGETVTGVLEDNPASRELLALLPLTVTLEDYGSVEKIARLPTRLKNVDAKAAMTPLAGDITYYIPWGNVAIFREDFRRSPGLIKLGRIEQGLAALRQQGAVEVKIKQVESQ